MTKHVTLTQRLFWLALVAVFLTISNSFAVEKKNAVLLPLAMYADPSKTYLGQGIRTMLLSRLSGEGIEIITSQKLEPLLTEQDKNGVTTPARAEELARALQTQYVIFGSFTALGAGYSFDLSILDLSQDPTKLTHISEPATEDQFIPRLSEIAYQFRSVIEGREIGPPSQTTAEEGNDDGIFVSNINKSRTLKPTGNLPLKKDVISFSMADLDKDGQTEWLVLTRRNLFIYTHKNDTLILKYDLKTVIGESFLKLSVGDLNNDNKPELFLVSLYGRSARTTIFAWNESFKKIAQMDGHLRALKVPDQDNFLFLFQNSEFNRFYSGKIYFMKPDPNGKLVKGDEIKLPKEARFYTLSLIDLQHDGKPALMGLGKNSRPYIWDMNGEDIWNGDETLGGTNNAVALKQASTYKDEEIRFEIESPMIITDVDHDGKKELLAIKNISIVEILRDFKQYSTSQLVAYKIEGTGLNQAWVSREIPYCIMDMAIDGKTLYMAVAKSKMTDLSAGSSRIMWFE